MIWRLCLEPYLRCCIDTRRSIGLPDSIPMRMQRRLRSHTVSGCVVPLFLFFGYTGWERTYASVGVHIMLLVVGHAHILITRSGIDTFAWRAWCVTGRPLAL